MPVQLTDQELMDLIDAVHADIEDGEQTVDGAHPTLAVVMAALLELQAWRESYPEILLVQEPVAMQ